MTKHYNQYQLGEERTYLAYMLQSVTVESQVTTGETGEACSACFHILARTTGWGDSAHSDCAFPQASLIKAIPQL